MVECVDDVGIRPAGHQQHADIATLAPKTDAAPPSGLAATVQAGGNVIASTLAGLHYTLASPAVAFAYVAACMAAALAGLAWAARPPTPTN